MKTAWHHRQQKHLLRGLAFAIFKVMGLAPFAIKNSNKVKRAKNSLQSHHRVCFQFVSSRLGGLYNVCLILGQLFMAHLSIKVEPDSQYPYKSNLTSIIELGLTISGNGIVTVIWLIYCTKQNTLTMLMNRLTNVDVTLDGMKGTSVGVCEHRSDFRNFIILFATNTFLWIQLLSSEELAFHTPMLMGFGFIVPSIFLNWFTVQYVLAINLIKNRFRLLNNILLRCSTTSIVFSLRAFITGLVSIDDFQVPKIESLRRAHTSLYEISSGVADFYSFPILLVIGYTSFMILYNAYYLVAPIVLGAEEVTYWILVNTILWIMIMVFPMTLLVAGVNGVTKEMKKTADVIPNLLAQPMTSRQDKTELEKFAFELLNKNVEYTGYTFFPLDGTLLQSVFGMVGTYIAIIFQLQDKSLRSHGPSSVAYNLTNSSTKAS